MVRAADCHVAVIAPTGLHRWRQEAAALQLQITLLSWAALPDDLPEAGTVLIADEAHYAQNLNAARTQAFLRLARHPRLRVAWLLSGTPMKNGRPAQLFPLLAAIGHPLAKDQRAFEERYCLGHWHERSGTRQWSATGATHLPELQPLCGPCCCTGASSCLDLPPSAADAARQLDRGGGARFQHRLQLKVEDYRRRAAAGLVRRDAEALAVLTALRQIGAEYKLPAAADLVARLQAEGQAVVVFTAFVAAAQLLQQRFGGALLTGRLAAAERQSVVDRFQAGEERS